MTGKIYLFIEALGSLNVTELFANCSLKNRTPVFKRELKLITTNVNEFFEIYPRNDKTYNTFIRGLAAMGEYQKAKEALIDMRVSTDTIILNNYG